MPDNDVKIIKNLTGVVLVWGERPQIGKYGYILPFYDRHTFYVEHDVALPSLFYFDEECLVGQHLSLHASAIVNFTADLGGNRPKLKEVKFETFEAQHQEFLFCEDAIFPDLEKDWYETLHNPRNLSGQFLQKLLSLDFQQNDEPMKRGGFSFALELRLNEIVSGPLIYDKYQFAKIKLRKHTQLLLAIKPQGSGLILLNRLLLEDALASATNSPLLDCEPDIVQGEVLKLDRENGCGALRTPFKPSRFDFECLPAETFIPPVGSRVQCRILCESSSDHTAYDVWEIPSGSKIPAPFAILGTVDNESPATTTKNKQGKILLPPKLILPLKFDWEQRLLISSNKISSPPLPLKYASVLKGFFSANPLNPKTFNHLSYGQVAEYYIRGKLKEERPNLSERDIKFRLENQRLTENPARLAHEFARDFRRWLKGFGIASKTLFACDRKSQKYCLIASGWALKLPKVNHSKARMIYQSNIEGTAGKKETDSGKKRSVGSHDEIEFETE